MHALLIDRDPDRSPGVMNSARSRWANTNEGCNDLNAGTFSMNLQSLEPPRLVNYLVIAIGDILGLNNIGSDISSLIWNEWPFANLVMEWPGYRKFARFFLHRDWIRSHHDNR